MHWIYLDHNATTPTRPEVVEAMARCYADGHANPASQHQPGQHRRVLEEARQRIVQLLGGRVNCPQADELVFTSGGTEACNLAVKKAIVALAKKQEDWAIFDSLPGAGDVMAPRLMAALGSRRERFESADELQSFAGIAPVKEASGNSVHIHFRRACPMFVRQTFHEWATCSIPQCEWAKDLYDRLKAKGKGRHVAIRAIAFKWMRILYRCWKNREPYREDVYLASLAKRSVNVKRLAEAVQMP